MNSNYVRIFFVAFIVMLFIILMARWEELFAPQPSETEISNSNAQVYPGIGESNTYQNNNNSNTTAVIALDNQDLQQKDIQKSTILNTEVFSEFEINMFNGAITKTALKDYNVSLNDQSPMLMLNSLLGSNYIAQSIIYVNGQPRDIMFSQQEITKENNVTTLILTGEIEELEISRRYFVNDKSYGITVEDSVTNKTGSPLSVSFDNQIIRQVASKNKSFSIFDVHSYSFEGIGLSSDKKSFQKESFSNLDKLNEKVQVATDKGWAAMIEHYFTSLWISNNLGKNFYVYANKLSDEVYQAGIKTHAVILAANESVDNKNILYTGPIITKNFETIIQDFSDSNKPSGLDKLIDYGLLSFISVVIFWLMTLIHEFCSNWGLSIIIVTILIKLLFYPLSTKSYKSMAKMRTLQPRMKKLQEIYKGDRQKLGRKMMEMYKEQKVNPASGCLPILIQIPVFIALYWVLLESVQLRQATFVLWIHDLSSKDPYFVLPVLMGISMLIQQKISPVSSDPIQAKVMLLMPIVFTVFFASFPSGLVLYWLTNNIISILQQWYITKKYTAIYKYKFKRT